MKKIFVIFFRLFPYCFFHVFLISEFRIMHDLRLFVCPAQIYFVFWRSGNLCRCFLLSSFLSKKKFQFLPYPPKSGWTKDIKALYYLKKPLISMIFYFADWTTFLRLGQKLRFCSSEELKTRKNTSEISWPLPVELLLLVCAF